MGPVGPQGTPGSQLILEEMNFGGGGAEVQHDAASGASIASIECDSNGSHILLLNVKEREHVIVTASPIGVPTAAPLTGFTQVSGPQSFNAPGSGSHRWQIVRVQQESTQVTHFDVVVIQTQGVCDVWIHKSN
jgi:hypothetical protein